MIYTVSLDADDDSVFTVHAAVPAVASVASPGGINADCPTDIHTKGIVEFLHFTDVHIHTPTTCDRDENGKYSNCQFGGIYAYECFPSSADWNYLLTISKFRFAFVQCGPDQIVPYFVHAYWWK
jgi:hypothetical protein